MKLTLVLVYLAFYVLMQLLNKNYKNVYFVDLNILWYLITLIFILTFYTIKKRYLYFNFIIVILIVMIVYFLFCKITINENGINIYRFLRRYRLIKIDDIRKIVLTNEFVTENSQFFLNFVLKDEQVEKIPLFFVSPLNLIKEILAYNSLIEVNLNLITKNIKLRKTVLMFGDLLLLMIFVLIVIYNTPIKL